MDNNVLDSDNYYEEIYSTEMSSRYKNEGDIGIYYRLPKFIELFYINFPSIDSLKLLEIGSGLGEIYDLIREKYNGQDFSFTLTEYSKSAVQHMKNKYGNSVDVFEADACNLPFSDEEFDIVCSFDVMHHVSDPQKMAKEILRVSKNAFFLCEANGLSIIRKIGEKSSEAKKLGEKSYFPWEYKKFFTKNEASCVNVLPFYFFVPPKIKKDKMKPFITISEIGQRVPLVKWQSQSLAIYGAKYQ